MGEPLFQAPPNLIEGSLHGEMTNQIAVARKQKSTRGALLLIGNPDVDEAYRFGLATTSRPRDTRDPDTKRRCGAAPDSRGHRFRDFGANGAVLLDQFAAHAEQVDLRFIRV